MLALCMSLLLALPLYYAPSVTASEPEITGLPAGDDGWVWQNRLPQGNDLEATDFYDAYTGWAVGALGTILKSMDGGSTWTKQASGTVRNLSDVHVFDSQAAIAVGESGAIRKTTDGGNTWVNLSVQTAAHFNAVHFFDASTGWIASTSGLIRKTTDGGETWTFHSVGVSTTLRDVYFLTSELGWAVGDDGLIVATADGGTTWETQESGTAVVLNSVTFTVDTVPGPGGFPVFVFHGLAVGASGTVLKTTDGGSTWSPQDSGTELGLNSVHIGDGGDGWAAGGFGRILKTTDGGTTWAAQTSGTTSGLQSVRFVDENAGWAVGRYGTIVKTADGGASWHQVSVGTVWDMQSVHFTDVDTGWAVGGFGTILGTTNGGDTWIAQASGTTARLQSVYFVNAVTGWTVGDSGTIRKSTDGGSTWAAQASGTDQDLRAVTAIDASIAIAVGESGTIRKTTDGGGSWGGRTSGTDQNLYDIHFIDANTGWAVGASGTVLKSVNGGDSWFAQTSGTDRPLYSVDFISQTIGWAVGTFGTILKTEDGGGTWIDWSIETSIHHYDVHFVNESVGWIVGSSGTYRWTRDGGTSWQGRSAISGSGVAHPLYAVCFVDNATGWVVGLGGTILHYEGAPLNARPVAVDDDYETDQGEPLVVLAPGVLGNDFDADGDELTAELVTGAAHGTLDLNVSGSLLYTPAAGFSGDDTFTYRAHDGLAHSDPATVRITVRPSSADPTDPAKPLPPIIKGDNRYATAIAGSKAAYPDGAEAVVIATGENFADALGGAGLAGALDSPLLLTQKASLPGPVMTEVGRLNAKKAYILGGTGAVSAQVESSLKDRLGASNVIRVAGSNRYQTADRIAAETIRVLNASGTYSGDAFIATGANFPDALGASPVAAAKGMPVFLADPARTSVPLPGSVKRVWITGGTAVVSAKAEASLKTSLGAGNVKRLAGANRFETAARVAAFGVSSGMQWEGVGITTGMNFPDALAAGPVLGSRSAVMLLTDTNAVPQHTSNVLTANKAKISRVTFFGGDAAVPPSVRTAVNNLIR